MLVRVAVVYSKPILGLAPPRTQLAASSQWRLNDPGDPPEIASLLHFGGAKTGDAPAAVSAPEPPATGGLCPSHKISSPSSVQRGNMYTYIELSLVHRV